MSKVFEATNMSTVPASATLAIHALGELPNIQATYRLNGKNYLQWSQLVRTFLKGKWKLSHLAGKGPDPSDLKFHIWDEEDSMIMS